MYTLFSKPHLFWIAALGAVVLSFALFGNGIPGKFLLDDGSVIVGNPLINDHLSGFGEIFVSPYHFKQPLPGLYRPLVIASYSLNWFFFGNSSSSFHVVNIFLHALAVFLVFLLAYRLSGLHYAAMTALLFLFLPIHVEAVTSIVGRAEILSFIFVLAALYYVLRERYLAAASAFFLALLSKENAIAFLLIFVFLELFYRKKSWRGVGRNLRYFAPPFLIYLFLRWIALGKHFLSNDATIVYNPIKFAPFWSGWWTSLKVFYLYLQKIFIPVGFSSDYSFEAIPLIFQPSQSWPTLAGLSLLGFFIWLLFKKRSNVIGLGVAIFLFSYFVISNWVFKTGTIMAERLMYLPSLGLVLMVAGGLEPLIKRVVLRKIIFVFLGMGLIWYGMRVVDRNRAWLNEANLFESAYAAVPQSVVNKTNKAYLYYVAKEYGEARQMIDEVLILAPQHVPALNLAGHIYKKQDKFKEAEEFWKKTIRLRKDFLRAYSSLGALYYENKYFQSAETVLTEAVDIYPRWSEVFLLSLTKTALGQYEVAIEVVEKNFGKDPQKELKFALGVAYYKKGDKILAETYLRQVKDPNITISEFLRTIEDSTIFVIGEF